MPKVNVEFNTYPGRSDSLWAKGDIPEYRYRWYVFGEIIDPNRCRVRIVRESASVVGDSDIADLTVHAVNLEPIEEEARRICETLLNANLQEVMAEREKKQGKERIGFRVYWKLADRSFVNGMTLEDAEAFLNRRKTTEEGNG